MTPFTRQELFIDPVLHYNMFLRFLLHCIFVVSTIGEILFWENCEIGEMLLFNVALNSCSFIDYISFDEMRLIEHSRIKSLAQGNSRNQIETRTGNFGVSKITSPRLNQLGHLCPLEIKFWENCKIGEMLLFNVALNSCSYIDYISFDEMCPLEIRPYKIMLDVFSSYMLPVLASVSLGSC